MHFRKQNQNAKKDRNSQDNRNTENELILINGLEINTNIKSFRRHKVCQTYGE